MYGNIMIGNFLYIKTRNPYKFDYNYRYMKGFESDNDENDDEYGSQIDEKYDLNEFECDEDFDTESDKEESNENEDFKSNENDDGFIPRNIKFFTRTKNRVHKYRELKKERLLKNKDNEEITVKISKRLSDRIIDNLNVFIGKNIGPIFNSGTFPFGNELYKFLTSEYKNADKNKVIAFIPIKCYCGNEFCDKHY